MKLELINRNVYTLSGAYVEITSRCNVSVQLKKPFGVQRK